MDFSIPQEYLDFKEAVFRYETVRGLLDQASIDIRDVDAVIGAGDDVLDGRSISNIFTAQYAGAFLKEESKVEEDGAYAASYAFMRIASAALVAVKNRKNALLDPYEICSTYSTSRKRRAE